MSDMDRPKNDDHKSTISRRDVLKHTAKVGVAAAATVGLVGTGGLPALAATSDTTGKGQWTNWTGLSEGEVNVLRLIATDSNFRASFIKNPKSAIKESRQKLTPAQVTHLSRMTRLQANSFAANAQLAIQTEGTSASPSSTLLHAIVYAIVIALLLAVQAQEGVATAGGAVPVS